MLGLLAVGLTFLRAVDAAEADAFKVLVEKRKGLLLALLPQRMRSRRGAGTVSV